MSNLTSSLNWQTAPYMVAEVALDRDNTLSLYCERDQIDKVPAALLRVIAPSSLQGDAEMKEAGLDIIGDQAAEILRLRARYRWLRDVVLKAPTDDAQKRIWVHEFTGPILYGESIDDAIDAAVALEEKAFAPPP